jgi:glycosyltransferase involved in cell wall biosynthesis
MKAIVTASFKTYVSKDGNGWTDNASLGYSFWKRYLNTYNEIYIFSRSKYISVISDDFVKITGEGIKILPCPYFSGPWQFAKLYLKIRKNVKDILNNFDSCAIQLRLPCPIGYAVFKRIKNKRPYGVEVVGDPWDVFSAGSVRHILRPFLKVYFTYLQKRACENAAAALYVTKNVLQNRYPCPNGMLSASSINLCDNEISNRPRQIEKHSPMNIIYVGSMSQLYKAPDILLKAFKICVKEGKDLHLTMLGDGKYRPKLEKLAGKLGISERVSFLGMVPKEEVFKRLDESDLFVLPSKTEGLPRAMIEAMARGLPCIGTTVGGIPELLPPEDLVPPGDVKALAAKIMEVINDSERMAKMSERNLAKAKEYKEDILQREREAFYSLVKERTEEWIMRNKGN